MSLVVFDNIAQVLSSDFNGLKTRQPFQIKLLEIPENIDLNGQNRREKRGRGKVKAPRHITVAGSEGRRGYHKAGPQRGSGRVEEAVA